MNVERLGRFCVATCVLLMGCGGIAIVDDGAGGSSTSASTSSRQSTTGSTRVSSAVQAVVSTGGAANCFTPAGMPCNEPAFTTCERQTVDGIPCCWIHKVCLNGVVTWEPAFCTDNCGQACELVTNPEHCAALSWCVLGPMGCETIPPT